MNRKIATLLCFLSLSLNLSLGLGAVFVDEQRQKSDPTLIINNYLGEYRASCGIKAEELETM